MTKNDKNKLGGFSKLAALLSVAALTTACSNLSGLGGSTSLSCPLDAGGTCQSIRTTYEQVALGQMGAGYSPSVPNPSQGQGAIYSGSNGATDQAKAALFSWNSPTLTSNRAGNRDVPASGQPIRSESDVLRVWVAPYEDDEGVLRDQSYAYVVLDNARWMIEHNQRRIMQSYAPVKAPASANKQTDSETTPSTQNIVSPSNPQ